MLRSYFLLNLILLALIGFLGFKFYKVWTRPLNLPSSAISQKAPLEKTTASVREEKEPDEVAFQVIVQKDLFRPSRTEPRLEEISKAAPVIPPKLYGTIIIENEKSAILEDPNTKVTKSYRINDSIAGFVVSDIQKDKVILLKEGGEKVEVYLREIKTFITPAPTPVPPIRRRPMRTDERIPPPSPPIPQQPLTFPEVVPPPPQVPPEVIPPERE